ncbi:hypothetical protein RRV45_13100 [Bacillus sp. DTU_2020_1000418_1_SI_GHA_SEK_038]|uniref:hypothetical protein n=1 Tax=Bacillus sp. DTU_2020_1000418_1_SI_GHA_SEK_038 TaxID=3077585 RepID=UPI0028EF2428|nr:hypothetical protein [Bacillus sp. DTU_2020_1000418_1_SI_GHA_SEK_038]WNS73855.1 hypothetical protein RRV45_13100 [Bacillus sp. DTU_2020_1000418_1_SI_GHA_SEK_038]
MNIQEYYKKSAMISLNASLASLFPPFLFILYGIIIAPNISFVLVIIPFLLYSLICYHYYLLNDQRSKEISILQNQLDNGLLLDKDQVILTFLPSPTLRMQIFDINGKLLGEIRDMQFWKFRWFLPYFLDRFFEKRYGFYDETNQLLRCFTLKKKQIEITDANSNVLTTIFCEPTNKSFTFTYDNESNTIIVKRSFQFMDIRFFHTNLTPIGRLRKGWMPLEWGNRFKDPNMPVLTFGQSILAEDKLLMYAIITKLFQSSNH